MKIPRKAFLNAFLVIILMAIGVFCRQPLRVENKYSLGLFPHIARTLRFGFGFFPLSLGDILYGCLFLWLLYKTIRFIVKPGKRWNRLAKSVPIVLVVQISFNVLWGINYNRLGIGYQMHLVNEKYTLQDLHTLNCFLLDKVNASRKMIGKRKEYPGAKKILQAVPHTYSKTSGKFPFLKYVQPSLKPSLWGWLGNYAGFTGYYNPFTAEAQVNTMMPSFIIPYTACHEVAHQLGYAKEDEANFVGYLAATTSDDPFFNYSAYLDVYLYANRKLFYADSISAKLYRSDLDVAVKEDIQEWITFNRTHSSPLEPLVWWVYGKFLEQNQQPQGIRSYDEVISLLIAYHKQMSW